MDVSNDNCIYLNKAYLFRLSTNLYTLHQYIAQNDSIIMLHIACSEQQGDMSPFHQLAQLSHGFFPTLGCQFRFVAFAKFREFVRIVAKPLAKFIARCDLL